MVITNATTMRIDNRAQKPSSTTSSSAITMISAERIRSVRTAPEIIRFSASGPISTLGAGRSPTWSSWWEIRSQTFSAPSNAR